MSRWGSVKARQVLAALLRIGWSIKRQSGGSHRVLARPNGPDFVFAFHDGEEIGPPDAGEDCPPHRTDTGRFLINQRGAAPLHLRAV